MRLLQLKEARTGVVFSQPILDTLLLSAVLHANQDSHQIERIAERLGTAIEGRHNALGDACATGEIFRKMLPLLSQRGIITLRQALEASEETFSARVQFAKADIEHPVKAVASRPEELHPRPLTERCVNLSIHTAPIKQTHRPCLSANARRDTASSRKAVRETCSPVSCGPSAVCTSSSPKPPTFC
jgi:hypothetical protein